MLQHTSLDRNGTELLLETLSSFTPGSAFLHTSVIASLYCDGLMKISHYPSLNLPYFLSVKNGIDDKYTVLEKLY
jgi:hypothetical protein